MTIIANSFEIAAFVREMEVASYNRKLTAKETKAFNLACFLLDSEEDDDKTIFKVYAALRKLGR